MIPAPYLPFIKSHWSLGLQTLQKLDKRMDSRILIVKVACVSMPQQHRLMKKMPSKSGLVYLQKERKEKREKNFKANKFYEILFLISGF